MKKKIRIILKLLLWILLLTGIMYLFFKSQKKQKSRLCTALVINMNVDQTKSFVTLEEINKLIRDSIGLIVDNKRSSEIDLYKIRQLLFQNPMFEDVSVYATLNSEIIIDIKQRTPVVRVFNKGNQTFYIDKMGILFPVSTHFHEHLLIAGGNVREPYKELYDVNTEAAANAGSVLNKIYKTAAYISQNSLLQALISEIVIDENGNLELIPSTGGHTVIFGDAEEFDEKFDRLLFFYENVLSKINWAHYKSINIKFKDLIFCTE